MDLDMGLLMSGLLASSVGYVLFSHGRKQSRLLPMLTGVALLAYPYFMPSAWLTLLVLAAVLAAYVVAVQRGH